MRERHQPWMGAHNTQEGRCSRRGRKGGQHKSPKEDIQLGRAQLRREEQQSTGTSLSTS